MNTLLLERVEAEIRALSLTEQLWLMERLAAGIRERTARSAAVLEGQLAEMAADPDIQRDLKRSAAEFSESEMDGLRTA